MLLPMKFVVGALVGACSTYIYKDANAREWAKNTGSKLGQSITALFANKKPVEAEAASEVVVDVTATEPAVEGAAVAASK